MDDDDAQAAMEALNGTQFGGRDLKVNEARERERQSSRPPRGGGRGGWDR